MQSFLGVFQTTADSMNIVFSAQVHVSNPAILCSTLAHAQWIASVESLLASATLAMFETTDTASDRRNVQVLIVLILSTNQ